MILADERHPRTRHARVGDQGRARGGGGRSGVDARLRGVAVKVAALACGYVAVRALIAVYWALWWVMR